MSEVIKVLLVDDKEDYCVSLAGVARNENIQIIYHLDWENGFESLKNDPEIAFIILDGKGKINEDQETEKDNFVFYAIQDILKWSSDIKRHIPYCVNTGFVERFEALEGNATIFNKTDASRKAMFEFIRCEVENSPYQTLRKNFNEPFKPFDLGIISKKHEHLLIDIITCYQNLDYRKKNLTVQRDLLEAIFKSLNNPIPCLPNIFFDQVRGNKPDLTKCVLFIEDRDTRDSKGNYHKLNKNINVSIKAAFRKIKESTNEFSHLNDEDVVKYPFISNTFLLMEILIWIPEFIEEHYSKNI